MTGCPDPERLQAALDRRLPEAEGAALLEHAGRCGRCRPRVEEHRGWERSFRSRPGAGSAGGCPSAEALAGFATSGEGREDLLAHLAACRSCREDVVAARLDGAPERAGAPFRARLYAMGPRPVRRAGWIAGAAAAAAVGLLAILLAGRSRPEPAAAPPRPAPKVAREIPLPEPEPPRPPAPEPPPRPAPPLVDPSKPSVPAAEKPAVPEPPPRSLPPPSAPDPAPPPKPAPPVKPPSEPTREKPKVRGAVLAVAGALPTKAEGEAAWQTTRASQSREFAGSIDVRSELNPVKFRLGSHTVCLQRRSEATLLLEEGGTSVRLARGEAVFDVAPGKGTFAVETAQGRVAVRGTRFLVAAERAETEVVVQRGRVEFAAAGASVALGAAERSAASEGKGPEAPGKADVARRLQWARALEETIPIEAEMMALQKGMAILPEPAASGGRAAGVKGHPAAGTEALADARVQVKQPAAPYAVWVRLLWNHGVAPAFSIQVHDHPKWDARGVAARPGWQWVRVGTYDVPAEPFRLRVADGQGGAMLDRFLVTTDLDLVPE